MRPDLAELIGDDFGRHVLGGAFDHAAVALVQPARDAEVAQLDRPVLVHQHVAGLDVPVDDAVPLQELQAEGHGLEQETQVVQVDRPALGHLDDVPHHQFQDQPAAVADQVVDGHDPRVFQVGDQLGFAPVDFQLVGILQVLSVDLLDRHVAVQFRVVRAEHGGVVPLRQFLHDVVPRMLRKGRIR